MKKTDKLTLWQKRLGKNDTAFAGETAKMDEREELYGGKNAVKKVVHKDKRDTTPHVRNICAELIEAQADSNIPQPKVTARRQQDEKKAKLIEDMLRNELDRMPFEQLNDIMERTVPIQGGALFLVEWDNTKKTHSTIGELNVSVVHPKQIVPQDGVYTGIEDMDYIILKMPQTKEYIKRKYGVDVSDESETEPTVKGTGGSSADDMVTQYVAYYRNEDGGIGLYSWVCDTELEDIEDYQARRLRRCAKCGMTETEAAAALESQTMDGTYPGAEEKESDGKTCPYCGSRKWEESTEDFTEIYAPIVTQMGNTIPGAEMVMEMGVDEYGMPFEMAVQQPTKIPFYKPDIYPTILQKNVSVYGKFLGDSDIDKIKDQQNTTNIIERTIIEKLIKNGSVMTLPARADIKVDPTVGKVVYLQNAADKAMIDSLDLAGEIGQDMNYLAQIYEEARQTIGITDSFQGRKDATATSGKAKEFAAAQSAGRLESKRIMKNAAYAALFEAMFKFKLAYADEPRPVMTFDENGHVTYEEFNKYDFLEQDEAGQWYWNDQFLFSCDTSAPLASNREAMWQETRMNLETGAFGNPVEIDTLILFWGKMEQLHYPGAGEVKAKLEQRLKKQQMQAAMQQQAQMQQRMNQLAMEVPNADAIIQKGRQQAQETMQLM